MDVAWMKSPTFKMNCPVSQSRPRLPCSFFALKSTFIRWKRKRERESTYLEAIQSISRQQVVRRLRRLAEKGFFEEKGFERHKCVLDTGNNTANEHSWYIFWEEVREMSWDIQMQKAPGDTCFWCACKGHLEKMCMIECAWSKYASDEFPNTEYAQCTC